MLASGAVALIDAHWIVRLAALGRPLAPRQALPAEAFLPLSEVMAAADPFDLRIVCVSHCWLQPDHPDPRGHNLRILASALRRLLEYTEGEVRPFRKIAVFYDFCSLHQGCRAPDGTPQDRAFLWDNAAGCFQGGAIGRLESEEVLFRKALGSLAALYSLPKTYVFMLTSFPPDYDDPIAYKRSGNCAPYFERGWCFCESSWAMMVKDSHMVLDLGKFKGSDDTSIGLENFVRLCAHGRRPPILPDTFKAQLYNKAFTNGHTDRPRVEKLYSDSFETRFSTASKLVYEALRWGDPEAEAMADLLEARAAPQLESLHLAYNSIGNYGARALAARLPLANGLCELDLLDNCIEREGAIAIANVLPATPSIRRLTFDGNHIGDHGAAGLARALATGVALTVLNLMRTGIGDNGVASLASALPLAWKLTELRLGNNFIHDAGARTLAAALSTRIGLSVLGLRNEDLDDVELARRDDISGRIRERGGFYFARNQVSDEAAKQLKASCVASDVKCDLFEPLPNLSTLGCG